MVTRPFMAGSFALSPQDGKPLIFQSKLPPLIYSR
jgi:hypothetical protein